MGDVFYHYITMEKIDSQKARKSEESNFLYHLIWTKPIGSFISFTRTNITKKTSKQHNNNSIGNHVKKFDWSPLNPDNIEIYKMSIIIANRVNNNVYCMVRIYNSSCQVIIDKFVAQSQSIRIIDKWSKTYPNTTIYTKYNKNDRMNDLRVPIVPDLPAKVSSKIFIKNDDETDSNKSIRLSNRISYEVKKLSDIYKIEREKYMLNIIILNYWGTHYLLTFDLSNNYPFNSPKISINGGDIQISMMMEWNPQLTIKCIIPKIRTLLNKYEKSKVHELVYDNDKEPSFCSQKNT